MRCSLVALLVAAAVAADVLPVVPQPREFSAGTQASFVRSKPSPPSFMVTGPAVCGSDCLSLLNGAFSRTVAAASSWHEGLSSWSLSIHPEMSAASVVPTPSQGAPEIAFVNVSLTATGDVSFEALPPLGDESYVLDISAAGVASITSPAPWGVLRALETLVQLMQWNGAAGKLVVARLPLHVADAPRFAYRGFLLDTSRHFFPAPVVRRLVDALAASKMNVLHLHLTDAQSFPLQLSSRPELAGKGAFSKSSVYTAADVASITEYARQRGVTVIPEIDMPAHAASWIRGYPNVVANCWDYVKKKQYTYAENVLALNPANDETWDVIDDVISETAKLFPTPFFHVGGDEVMVGCWQNAKEAASISAWMKKMGITSYSDVNVYFDQYAQTAAQQKAGKQVMVYEDVFSTGAVLNSDVIVQAWRSREVMANAVRQGNRAVLNYGYYQDMQVPLCVDTTDPDKCKTNWMWSWTHRDMYAMDPVEGLGLTPEEEKRVLGAEVSSWSESCDPTNLDDRALSRSISVAERFWSRSDIKDADDIEVRALRYRCLALRRGISSAGPLYSDFCEVKSQ